ncbi:B3 domain-containing transcription factor VRN1-like isoform X2 [Cornus florida]|uniref:B3 domain-containing transcription factor VRN1-like isoform X2 n=1 Tax=Cornus florida TaxID=4283 RepID=UPI00289F316C|nr:B3 domain-containing transcription factor VRN1-like isoform X2 [Cornus florida]
MEPHKRKRKVKPNGSDCRRSKSPVRASSKFFKIILPSVINEKKLTIPKKFVRKYGDELSAVAMLTVPTGHVSHVGLEKADKMLWFCDGWQQFMERYSISCGYFLVFKYKGKSSFDVLIFDLTATEIQYSCTIRSSSEENNNGKFCQLSDEDEIEDDDSVEILGSLGFVGSSSKISLGLDKKGKSAALLESSKPTPRCLTRTKRYKKDQEQTIELENWHGACGRKPSRSETSNWHDSLLDKSKRKNQFVTKNIQNLQTSAPTVRDRGFDQLNESELKDKTYRIDVEEQHPTKIANSSHVATQRNRDTSYQTTNQRIVSRGSVINEARERATNAARMFKPENPFHMAILRPYNVNHHFFLNIPLEFAMKMKSLLGVSDIVKLQVSDGREWHVHYIHKRRRPVVRLCKGWRTFVKENNLMEGDICVFELIKVMDLVLKVSIFRTAEYAGQPNLPHQFDESIYSKTTNQRTVSRGPLINQAREGAINAARMFKSENPFHMVILRPNNVNNRFSLNIPSEFAMKIKYLLGVSDIVKLQVSDGREWRVRCIHDSGGRQAILSKGWRMFAKENNLVEGDVCVFELIKVLKDLVIQVSIFRAVEYAGQVNQPLDYSLAN